MKKFAESLEKKITKFQITNFEVKEDSWLIIFSANKNNFKEIIKFLKEDKEFCFTILTDLTASDYPDRDKRFEIIYNLLSIMENVRVIIKVAIDEKDSIESIFDIYNASVWYEREVYDMFGVIFNQNPDLRRILTDYGFSGHPLRKDFPLTGYKEVRYDEEQKKVIYEPVTLTQDYRKFDFISPWEGSDYVLPGDEKAKK